MRRLKAIKASLLFFILLTGTAGGYTYLQHGYLAGAFGAIISYQVFFSAMIIDHLSYISRKLNDVEEIVLKAD